MVFANRTPGRMRMGLPGWLLVALPLIALLPKFLLITHTLGASGTLIFQTGFGFGDYVQSLAHDGTFRSCSTFPYQACGGPVCNYATRMPGLPVLYTALAEVVGDSSASVALAKCALTALLAEIFLYTLARDAQPSAWATLLMFGLYLGPQSLKHGASLEYEEGLLVDLELCFAIALLYLWRPELTDSLRRRSTLAVAAVGIATAMYFVKATALLALVVAVAAVLFSRHITRTSKIVAVVCATVPMLLWVGHNYAASGEFHLSSSWNGENLYRGSSAEGLALYPQISLDRMFDSTQATLPDGHIVPLHNLTAQRCFRNEWEWNRFYAQEAGAWARQHPLDWLQYQLHKLWTALLEPRHTPYSTSSDGAQTEYPPALSWVMLAWMIAARAVFLALLVALTRSVLVAPRNGAVTRQQAIWVLAVLAAGWAPYLGVFSYQRHLVPLLVMAGALFAGLFLVTPRPLQNRHTKLVTSLRNAP